MNQHPLPLSAPCPLCVNGSGPSATKCSWINDETVTCNYCSYTVTAGESWLSIARKLEITDDSLSNKDTLYLYFGTLKSSNLGLFPPRSNFSTQFSYNQALQYPRLFLEDCASPPPAAPPSETIPWPPSTPRASSTNFLNCVLESVSVQRVGIMVHPFFGGLQPWSGPTHLIGMQPC